MQFCFCIKSQFVVYEYVFMSAGFRKSVVRGPCSRTRAGPSAGRGAGPAQAGATGTWGTSQSSQS